MKIILCFCLAEAVKDEYLGWGGVFSAVVLGKWSGDAACFGLLARSPRVSISS